MYKLIILAAVLAVAATKPAPTLLAYSAAPVVHSSVLTAPLAYSAPAIATPIAYSVPAAHSYVSGYNVAVHAEPVEQHGYKIVY